MTMAATLSTSMDRNPRSFFKIMVPPNLHSNKLRIPKVFARRFAGELSTTSTLTVPTGESWNVALVKEDNELWFQKGWQEFVEHFSISYAYFLLFIYGGNSKFDVHIFNLTGCEISYSSNACNGPRETNKPHYVEEKAASPYNNSVSFPLNNQGLDTDAGTEVPNTSDVKNIAVIEIDSDGEPSLFGYEDQMDLAGGDVVSGGITGRSLSTGKISYPCNAHDSRQEQKEPNCSDPNAGNESKNDHNNSASLLPRKQCLDDDACIEILDVLNDADIDGIKKNNEDDCSLLGHEEQLGLECDVVVSGGFLDTSLASGEIPNPCNARDNPKGKTEPHFADGSAGFAYKNHDKSVSLPYKKGGVDRDGSGGVLDASNDSHLDVKQIGSKDEGSPLENVEQLDNDGGGNDGVNSGCLISTLPSDEKELDHEKGNKHSNEKNAVILIQEIPSVAENRVGYQDERLMQALASVGISRPKNPFFTVALGKPSVYGLTIPVHFAREYMKCKDGGFVKVESSGGKQWQVQYCRRDRWMFTCGWRIFIQENNLTVGDVCAVELIDANKHVLKVHVAKKSQIDGVLVNDCEGTERTSDLGKALILVSQGDMEVRRTLSPLRRSERIAVKVEDGDTGTKFLDASSDSHIDVMHPVSEGVHYLLGVEEKIDTNGGGGCGLDGGYNSGLLVNSLQSKEMPRDQIEGNKHSIATNGDEQKTSPDDRMWYQDEGLLDVLASVGILRPKNPFFTLLVKKHHLRCPMNIPVHFAEEYMRYQNGNVVKVETSEGKQWPVQCRRTNRWKLCGGWSIFARESNLEVGDVCAFELTDAKNRVLRVHIAKKSQITAARKAS